MQYFSGRECAERDGLAIAARGLRNFGRDHGRDNELRARENRHTARFRIKHRAHAEQHVRARKFLRCELQRL